PAKGVSFDSKASLTTEQNAPVTQPVGPKDLFEPIRSYELQSDQTGNALQELLKANPNSENAKLVMLLHDTGIGQFRAQVVTKVIDQAIQATQNVLHTQT